ncbi:MAG: TolC family protein [Sphingomonadales bacterium]|nr:TolC family protein [Sphingomonadales bacterium]MBM3935997.1 TolC family protein [Sphingomonadales bacterium]
MIAFHVVIHRWTLWLALSTGALFLGFTPGYASDSLKTLTIGWTLEECVRYALEHNLSLRQGALQVNGANLDLQAARLAMTPSLNGSAGISFNNGRAIDPFTNTFIERTVESNQLGISGSWLLYQGSQLQHQLRAARLGQGASVQEQEALRNNIALSIANAFLQVLLSKELTAVAEQQRASTVNQLTRIRQLVNAGSMSVDNQYNLEAQLASDEVTLTNAANNAINARIGLALLLQVPDPERFEVAVPDTASLRGAAWSAGSANALYRDAVGRQPQVIAADLRLNQSLFNLKATKALRYPRVGAFVNLSTLFASTSQQFVMLGEYDSLPIGFLKNAPSQIVVQPIPKYRTSLVPRGEQFRNNLGSGMGLSLSIPLWNNGQVRIAEQRSRNAMELARLQSEQSRNTLYSDITRAVTDYRAAVARLSTNQINLDAQKANYTLAAKRYEEGLLPLADYLNAKNRLQIAESSWLQAYYEEIFRLKVLAFYEGNFSWKNP